MGLINFIQLSRLFDATGLDTFTFSNDAIEAVPHGGESDRLKVFYQCAFLSLPCTERQLYDWAQYLDRHEGFHVEPEKRHHFVDRLTKDFKEKWQLDNEQRKDWYFQLGFKPDNVESADNLAHWLTLAKWTKEQAAHLICGSNPRQAQHYDALDMLLERMPSIDTQAPIEWLKWADDQDLLDCAPSRIREWYAENQNNPMMGNGAVSHTGADTKIRKGKYGAADISAIAWLSGDTKPCVEDMTNPQIHKALVRHDNEVWGRVDFIGWNRGQTVWPKKSSGNKRRK